MRLLYIFLHILMLSRDCLCTPLSRLQRIDYLTAYILKLRNEVRNRAQVLIFEICLSKKSCNFLKGLDVRKNVKK